MPAGNRSRLGFRLDSERRSLLCWAGCEQPPKPTQLSCLLFPSHAPLICTAAASKARWAKAPGSQARSTRPKREVCFTELLFDAIQVTVGYGAKAQLATWELHPAVAVCIAGVLGTALAAREADHTNIADKSCCKP